MFSDIASLVKTGAGVALIAAAWFWHADQVRDYADEVRGMNDAASARGALILSEANIKLKESNDALTTERGVLNDLVGRLTAGDRLRQQEVERFQRDLQSATQAQLRQFAEASDANFQRSRNHVERFGREAIECSITAHQQARDAVVIDDAWTAYFEALKGTTK